MRRLNEMKGELENLASALTKFIRISKMPLDFGVGIPIFPTEIHTVAKLCEYGPMSITELAKMTSVTKPAMSQLISKLEKKGLVYREIAPDNRSKQIVTPTQLGEKAQDGHLKFHMEQDRNFFSYIGSLSDEDYKVFKEICIQINSWMDNYLK